MIYLLTTLHDYLSSLHDRSILILGLGAILMLVSCSEDGTGPGTDGALEIVSITPAPGSTDVKVGATISLVFSEDVDPATLTTESFRVERLSLARPSVIGYDSETRTATMVAPLLPDRPYEVAVTSAVTTPSGEAMAAPQTWSFRTRAWEPVTVGAGTLGSLRIGSDGRRHVTYRNDRDLMYATCTGGCSAAADWSSVTLHPGAGRFGFSPVALDPGGGLHVSYGWNYTTCASGCTAANAWGTVTVYSNVGGPSHSIEVDQAGRVHAVYREGRAGHLIYATCPSICIDASRWESVTVDGSGRVGVPTSLFVEPGGRIHVTYFDFIDLDLEYATCDADCATADAWMTLTLDAFGAVGFESSVVADERGRIHVTYFDEMVGRLKYATCSAACSVASNWDRTGADQQRSVGRYSSLAVDGNGRLHVTYQDVQRNRLKYATCTTGCVASAVNWETVTVDDEDAVGAYTSLALGSDGRLHVVYDDTSNGQLRYID